MKASRVELQTRTAPVHGTVVGMCEAGRLSTALEVCERVLYNQSVAPYHAACFTANTRTLAIFIP